MASAPNGCKGNCGIQIQYNEQFRNYDNALQNGLATIQGLYSTNPNEVVTFENGKKHVCPLYVKGAAPGTYQLIELLNGVQPVYHEERGFKKNANSPYKKSYTNTTTTTAYNPNNATVVSVPTTNTTQPNTDDIAFVQTKKAWDSQFKHLEAIASNTTALNTILTEIVSKKLDALIKETSVTNDLLSKLIGAFQSLEQILTVLKFKASEPGAVQADVNKADEKKVGTNKK